MSLRIEVAFTPAECIRILNDGVRAPAPEGAYSEILTPTANLTADSNDSFVLSAARPSRNPFRRNFYGRFTVPDSKTILDGDFKIPPSSRAVPSGCEHFLFCLRCLRGGHRQDSPWTDLLACVARCVSFCVRMAWARPKPMGGASYRAASGRRAIDWNAQRTAARSSPRKLSGLRA